MFRRAIALLLSLTLLWSGAAMAGQVVSSPAPDAGRWAADASPLAPALALVVVGSAEVPLVDLPVGPQGEEPAPSQHGEPLHDVVALLPPVATAPPSGWQPPRPPSGTDALPRAPHLQGLRRPPRGA